MNILACDDEPLALDLLSETIKTVLPEANISSFLKVSQILASIMENQYEIVFLDINMRGMSGIELALKIKKLNPNANIIFVTGYNQYISEAMSMHASGYITKPVTAEKVCAEIEDLRHPILEEKHKLLTVKSFGNFEVYAENGEMIHFERSKCKEALAYLIYREGSSCTTREIASILFEDEEYGKTQRGYVQKILSSLSHSLKKVNAESVIIKNYNSVAINTSLIECDFYNYIDKDSYTKKPYLGEFMAQYSWAEFAIGYLEEMFWKSE